MKTLRSSVCSTPTQSLYVGDYRASERTFSLITQVIGRSGRGDVPGRAVIQTFTPANETIQQAARQDYDAFYRSEIRLRKLNGTPPFSEVLAVTVSGAQENAVVRCCAYIRDYFRQTVGERAEVLGPGTAAGCAHEQPLPLPRHALLQSEQGGAPRGGEHRHVLQHRKIIPRWSPFLPMTIRWIRGEIHYGYKNDSQKR